MINRVGEFEKVGFEEYLSAMRKWFKERDEPIDTNEDLFVSAVRVSYDEIKLPTRATSGSAGYDFSSTVFVELPPKHTVKIPTGIRVKMEDGWFLACFPRSGLGFKYRLQLDNSVGIIDSDFYFSDNGGHIYLKFTNDSYENKTLAIDVGDKIAQGIFIPYGITYSDNVENKRNGGFGSTGK